MDADRYVDAFRLNLSLPPNVLAFIATIRTCEGTNGPEGWRALYGWRKGRDERLFTDMSVHPRRRFWIKSGDEWQPGEPFGSTETTTAAGALQINWPTWADFLTWRAGEWLSHLPFDQAGQTACGVWLIQHRAKAYDDIVAGRAEIAMVKAAPIWASLPGSLAGQHPRDLNYALTAYLNNGGALA